MRLLISALFAATLSGAVTTQAQQTPAPQPEAAMTLARLSDIILSIDPEAKQFGNGFEFTLQDIPVLVITDPRADRMRAMVPIRSVEDMDREELMRLMQANFDAALDARYAVAQGKLWGVFIHPLAALEHRQFLSGLVQTINVARTYGGAYSGGALVFGGGDSNGLYQELFDELLKKGQEL